MKHYMTGALYNPRFVRRRLADMFLLFVFGAAIKSAPFARRDYSAQADLVVTMLMDAQNEVFELGQMADYYGDNVTTRACDFANYLLEYTTEYLEMTDPRFQDDDWWLSAPTLQDAVLPFLSPELNLKDAAIEMASVGITDSWDPDDAQSTAEPESIAHTTY